MPAYFFVDVREVKNPEKMAEYRSRVGHIVEKFGGQYVVAGGTFEVKEGSYQPNFLVMIQFPSMDAARRWYDSEEYRPLLEMRLAATTSNAFLVAGLEKA
jgi:uncharacterized protein (DUF1330 family)